jgi:hypothetical protein
MTVVNFVSLQPGQKQAYNAISAALAQGGNSTKPLDQQAFANLISQKKTGISGALTSGTNIEVLSAAQKVAVSKLLASVEKNPTTAPSKSSIEAVTGTQPPQLHDSDYKFNLPPHAWSKPVLPATINNHAEDSQKNPIVADGISARPNISDDNRRGKLWYWYSAGSNEVTGTSAEQAKQQNWIKDRKYGFQFMWNPETYSTSVSLNTSVTPSPFDDFALAVGAFPANQQVNFTCRVDRTNDFYCFKGLSQTAPDGTASIKDYSSVATYYDGGKGISDFNKKIDDLLRRGTLADIEYIYRAVSGGGIVNIAGIQTSDIGYLPASLCRFDLGPVSYVGYINSLSVEHQTFNQSMIPIRSDVSISFNVMSVQTTAGSASVSVSSGA